MGSDFPRKASLAVDKKDVLSTKNFTVMGGIFRKNATFPVDVDGARIYADSIRIPVEHRWNNLFGKKNWIR
jgi:hypothetical protein